MNAVLSLDRKVFSIFYSLAGKSPGSDAAIVFFADNFIFLVLGLVAAWYLWNFMHRRISRANIVALTGSLAVTTGVYTLLKNLIMRLRPFVALGIPHLVNDTSYAFPSGHTATIFALATAVWFRNRSLGIAIGICGFLVGVARIAGGVHWPSDILGGAILGILVGVLIELLVRKISKKR
jgi:undecaprenyl-diphosphatase